MPTKYANICGNMDSICINMQNMLKICINIQQKYAQYVEICKNMHRKYANICKNIYSICKNIQKYAVKYAKYAILHILHHGICMHSPFKFKFHWQVADGVRNSWYFLSICRRIYAAAVPPGEALWSRLGRPLPVWPATCQ